MVAIIILSNQITQYNLYKIFHQECISYEMIAQPSRRITDPLIACILLKRVRNVRAESFGVFCVKNSSQ